MYRKNIYKTNGNQFIIKQRIGSSLFLLFILFFLGFKVSAQKKNKPDTLFYVSPIEIGLDSGFIYTKIDSIINKALQEKAFPGCQVLAAKDGEIFFYKSYGFHNYDSITPVTENSVYDFASVTKITGPLPAIMKLYDEGKLNLDTPFCTYWSDFKHSNKKDITLREILAHQARLVPWIPFWKMAYKKNGKVKKRAFKSETSKKHPIEVTQTMFLHKKYLRKIYKSIKKSPLLEEKKYKYSGLSFFLYPELIKKLTGIGYETYLAENFYNPLGINLTYNPLRKIDQSRIVPTEYDSIFRKQQIQGYVHDESAAMLGGVSGNAGLFGTALDLAKIMQMYLNGGTYGGSQFLSDSAVKEFTRCQYPENENRRGLGFDKPLLKNKENGSTAVDASKISFGHAGFTGTFCWADPENGILFVFMSNRVYPTRNNSKLYQLNIRPSIHQVLYDACKKIEVRNFEKR
jgi:beta-N-acetylhexosaminidase